MASARCSFVLSMSGAARNPWRPPSCLPEGPPRSVGPSAHPLVLDRGLAGEHGDAQSPLSLEAAVRRIPAALLTMVAVATILLSGQTTAVGSGNAKPHPTHSPRPTATPRPSASPTASPTASPMSSPTASPTASPSPTPSPGSCTLFPSDNVWNKAITSLPVRSDSAAVINAIGLSTGLHPDFSSLAWNGGLGYGIPFNVVGPSTPRYQVSFYYPTESDAGPYPIPNNPL